MSEDWKEICKIMERLGFIPNAEYLTWDKGDLNIFDEDVRYMFKRGNLEESVKKIMEKHDAKK